MKKHPMRREKKEIGTEREIEEILKDSRECRIGLNDEGVPYIVPMNFGWERVDGKITIYIHSAGEGRKLAILRKGEILCFQTGITGEIETAPEACDWGMEFSSLIGWGKPEELQSSGDRAYGLNILMEKYSGKTFTFSEHQLKQTSVFRISLDLITGKKSI